MKYALCAGLILAVGCSGPVPLSRAIWPRHQREYEAALAHSAATPRAAWYAYRAQQESKSVEQVQQDDGALSTTHNPFNARRDPAAVSRGAVIFQEHCARCHGFDVRGQGPDMLASHPTRDFHAFDKRFAVTLHGGAPRAWFRKIAEGYGPEVAYPEGPGPAMPAFGETLAREQIWLAITYLQSLEIDARSPPADQGED